jgi:hypothetical protein
MALQRNHYRSRHFHRARSSETSVLLRRREAPFGLVLARLCHVDDRFYKRNPIPDGWVRVRTAGRDGSLAVISARPQPGIFFPGKGRYQ